MKHPLSLKGMHEVAEIVRAAGESVLITRQEGSGAHFRSDGSIAPAEHLAHFRSDGSIAPAEHLTELRFYVTIGSLCRKFQSEDDALDYVRAELARSMDPTDEETTTCP
jgi:hypothetical protein